MFLEIRSCPGSVRIQDILLRSLCLYPTRFPKLMGKMGIHRKKGHLQKQFVIKDLKRPKYFLRIKIAFSSVSEHQRKLHSVRIVSRIFSI